jgi:hypothetical protein
VVSIRQGRDVPHAASLFVEAVSQLRYNRLLEEKDMKLADKIRALLRSRVAPSPARSRRIPRQRPGPVARALLPIESGAGWGFILKPADDATRFLDDLAEQLALEAYLNGADFRFSDEELASRVLAAVDRAVGRGELVREEASGGSAGRERWISAQQEHIDQLVAWWHMQGGPDVEAKVI